MLSRFLYSKISEYFKNRIETENEEAFIFENPGPVGIVQEYKDN